jgi:hypothetical protein
LRGESGIETLRLRKRTIFVALSDVTKVLPGDVQIQLRKEGITSSLLSEGRFFRMMFLNPSNIEEFIPRIEANLHQGRWKTTV